METAKNKSKIMWKIINGTLHINKNKSTQNISKVKNASSVHVTNSFDIANSFNNFFVNVGKSMSDKIPYRENVIHSPRVTKSFVLSETNKQEVCKLIDKLNDKKSSREDDIPVKFIKLSANVIAVF